MALTTQFDYLFTRHAPSIPKAYLRALGYRESQLNPLSTMPGSVNAARGLMQVVGVVRQDYNERNGTNYQPDDLYNPDINVKLATSTLKRIITAYNKHPSPNLKTNWANPEFVKLLTAGWNAGYSEAGGLGRVATYLEKRGIPVTHDNVVAYADDAGAVGYLSRTDRQLWHRSVADLYYKQPDWNQFGLPTAITALLVVGVAYGTYRLLRHPR